MHENEHLSLLFFFYMQKRKGKQWKRVETEPKNEKENLLKQCR